MCVQNCCITSHDTAKDKLNYDATGLIRRAVKSAGMPLMLLSDRLGGFGTAHHSVMGIGLRSCTIHFAKTAVNKIHAHNNRHERRNGGKADRMANTRGFNSDTPALLILNIIHHNFLRPHMGLNGKTPAEVEGIAMPGDGKLHNADTMRRSQATEFLLVGICHTWRNWWIVATLPDVKPIKYPTRHRSC